MADKIIAINCSFPNEATLYASYMPFVMGGGLFIRTSHTYSLGQLIDLKIQLIDESDPYEVSGKVIWITPKGAQGNKPFGIGIQFIDESSRHLRNKIETYLAGMLKSTQATDTM